MEDWRSSSGCLANGFEHYASYNGRSSWGGRVNRPNNSRSSSRASSRSNSRRGSKDYSSTEFVAKQNNQKQKDRVKRQAQSMMRLEKEAWNIEQQQQQQHQQSLETVASDTMAITVPTAPESKSPTPPAAVNSNNNCQTEVPQVLDEFVDSGMQGTQSGKVETGVNEEDKDKDPIVAAKNEENNKQTAAAATASKDSAPASTGQTTTGGGGGGVATSVGATNPPAAENVINKVVSKINYEQDQWSPANPDGKKKYGKDFIMKLRHKELSMKKPDDLPFPDLYRDNTKQRPPERNFISATARDDIGSLFPSFISKNLTQRNSQVLQKKGSQTSKPKGSKPSVIHVFYSQDVKLHETENAWKPSRNTTNKDLTEEEIKTEELLKRARGVLNKLTPERFDTLVNQFKALPIDNKERLNKIIDLVFEKAVDEPNFSVAYALMCKNIQDHKVSDGEPGTDGKPPPMTTFKKLLLTKCQKEFEKDMSAEKKKREETLKEIELETDPEKKKFMQLNYEESERRVRMKSVGISRFIGELFKLNMLTIPIMHSCISRLLNEEHEESLECLCKLLTTIGRDFEKKVVSEGKSSSDNKDVKKNDAFNDLSSYFKRLSDIAKNKGSKKVSSRVRFMIQDLIDLRINKWVPRRDDAVPKTFDQIHKDRERQTFEMNLALNSSQDRKRQDSRNSLDNRKRGGADSSGWQLVTPQNRKDYVIKTSKLKVDQSDIDLGYTISLGNRNQFLTWGQGSGSGKMDNKKIPGSNNNMYSVLGDNTLTQPSSMNSNLKGPSLSSEKDRMFSSYKSNYDDGRSSRSGSQQGPDSRSSSRDSASSKHDDRGYVNASGKGHPPSGKSSSQPPPNVIDDPKIMEMLQQKTKLLIQEYINFPDLKETEFSLELLRPTAPMAEIVAHIVRNAMDMRGSNPKRSVGEIMNHLIKKNIVPKGQYLDGLSRTLEVADDLVIDMPLIWLYFAEVILDVIIEGNLTFCDLADLLKSRQGTPDVAKLLSSLFKFLVEEKTASWVEQKWLEDGVNLTDFIDAKDVEKFVKDSKLEFLLEKNTDSSKRDLAKKDSIKNELYKMISSRTSFDNIRAWIDENVPPKKRATPEFIKALMTALLEASITPSQSSYKLDSDFFSNYEQLIIRYTDHSEELELPCLYAVQAFLHKLEFPQVPSCYSDHVRRPRMHKSMSLPSVPEWINEIKL